MRNLYRNNLNNREFGEEMPHGSAHSSASQPDDFGISRSLADLEFKDCSVDGVCSFEKHSLKKMLHRHYKDKHFNQMQRKIAEEYQNLKEVAIEMGEAEAAYYEIMQARQKLVDVYKDLVVKSATDETT